MERYLLDTNILVFLVTGNRGSLSKETKEILADFSNQLYTSSIAAIELLQLYRLNKIKTKLYKTADEILAALEEGYFIQILPFSKEHAKTLSKLTIANGHNDPFDHSIISHAVTEKLTVLSSDRQFENYVSQKLKFVFNRR